MKDECEMCHEPMDCQGTKCLDCLLISVTDVVKTEFESPLKAKYFYCRCAKLNPITPPQS